jgi:hypothetical protein
LQAPQDACFGLIKQMLALCFAYAVSLCSWPGRRRGLHNQRSGTREDLFAKFPVTIDLTMDIPYSFCTFMHQAGLVHQIWCLLSSRRLPINQWVSPPPVTFRMRLRREDAVTETGCCWKQTQRQSSHSIDSPSKHPPSSLPSRYLYRFVPYTAFSFIFWQFWLHISMMIGEASFSIFSGRETGTVRIPFVF